MLSSFHFPPPLPPPPLPPPPPTLAVFLLTFSISHHLLIENKAESQKDPLPNLISSVSDANHRPKFPQTYSVYHSVYRSGSNHHDRNHNCLNHMESAYNGSIHLTRSKYRCHHDNCLNRSDRDSNNQGRAEKTQAPAQSVVDGSRALHEWPLALIALRPNSLTSKSPFGGARVFSLVGW